MDVRILDLDGGITHQKILTEQASEVVCLQDWGPRVRLGCSWSAFHRFEQSLAERTRTRQDASPQMTFVGSGDFHHVSLALLRRLRQPCNLLILDNHPDWMRGIPFLHCGTWVYHATGLPQIQHVYHVGGDVDFDNYYRWMVPWSQLRQERIRVISAVRRYERGGWKTVRHDVLRERADQSASPARIAELIAPWREELSSLPLYVSLDRDVLRREESVVNWDSGFLSAQEVIEVIEAFVQAGKGLAGLDVVGDYSNVVVQGLFRRGLHWSEHPSLAMDPEEARRINEPLNLRLVQLARERWGIMSR